MVSVVVHTNTNLAHQIEFAHHLVAGFQRRGLAAGITADKRAPADIHVIQGPWYARREWQGQPNVLYLDRCFYGDARQVVSLGWLRPDGSRDFRNQGMATAKGPLPHLAPAKTARRCAVVFGDYGADPSEWIAEARREFDSVFFRPHPAAHCETPVMTLPGELEACWDLGDVAIGGASTVLVAAALNGLEVITHDPRHVCAEMSDRAAWLRDLSWTQWGAAEIASGAFWEHLCIS